MRVLRGRRRADLASGDEVVVFLIGMRINRLWQVWRWIPIAAAMPTMITELVADRSLGLLGQPRTFVSGRTIVVHQYWSSFEALERYARDRDRRHLPAWRRFNKRVGSDGSVGIFHETYRVTGSTSETLYANMPSFGLAQATELTEIDEHHQSAAARLGLRVGDASYVETG